MSAFDRGRVGLWCNSLENGMPRLQNIAKVFDGMFSDVFLPRWASKIDLDRVRATRRPDGSFLKAHIHSVPGALSAADYAALIHEDISRTLPGVVELNIEEKESVGREGIAYTKYIEEVLRKLHETDKWMRFRVNIAPYKGIFLPSFLIAITEQFYAAEQPYYGEMSRVESAEALADLISCGIPFERCGICYGAATEPKGPNGEYDANGKRQFALGSMLYKGRFVRKLSNPAALVFSDDLLADAGKL